MIVPTKQQQNIINHEDGHGIVIAGPGSGKTVTLVAHVSKLIKERGVSQDQIWVMAFNRDISTKLREKIENELGDNSPRVTTIHSFIISQTLTYGAELLGDFEIAESLGECGIDSLLWKPISKRLKERHNVTKTPQGKRFDVRHVRGFLWNEMRDYWLTSEEPIDLLFEKFKFELERSKRIYKIVFLDELALKFLEAIKNNNSFRSNVTKERILIDEFQDLNPTEHGILQQFHKEGTNFMVFGDDDQAINDFRRAHADYIQDFIKLFLPVEYPLSRDRRCPKVILDFADRFVVGLPRLEKESGYANHEGQIDILNFEYDEDEICALASIVEKYISLFQDYDDTPQVLILSGRTGQKKNKSRITEIIEILRDFDIENVTGDEKKNPMDSEWGLAFKSLLSLLVKGLTPMSLAGWFAITNTKLMKEIQKYVEKREQKGDYLDFKIAVLDISKKNSEIKEVLSDINEMMQKIKNGDFDPNIIIEHVPNNLAGMDEAKVVTDYAWKNAQQETLDNNGKCFLKALDDLITEDIKKTEIGRIHVTTYRKAKGLEADLVIVTSVDTCDFPFDRDQAHRLLYVAATRTKRNLIMTFANNRQGVRRFSRGRAERFKGHPRVFRSGIIPLEYSYQRYSEEWLKSWKPI